MPCSNVAFGVGMHAFIAGGPVEPGILFAGGGGERWWVEDCGVDFGIGAEIELGERDCVTP